MLYQLQLKVCIDDKRQSYIYDHPQWYTMRSFRLRISESTFPWTSHYHEESSRQLILHPFVEYQFLFDIHFKAGNFMDSPGK